MRQFEEDQKRTQIQLNNETKCENSVAQLISKLVGKEELLKCFKFTIKCIEKELSKKMDDTIKRKQLMKK